jgi:hypothetical protein
VGSGKALTFFQSDSDGEASVGLSAPTGRDTQRWLIEQASDGRYRITPFAAGYFLCATAGQAYDTGVSLLKAGNEAEPPREWDIGPP